MGNAESGEPEYHDIVLTGEAEPQALRGDGARLEEVMSRSRSSSDPRAKKRPLDDVEGRTVGQVVRAGGIVGLGHDGRHMLRCC